ncbi:hypothetical protein BC828DRAFT_403301 [Blastocladiella britannica]|nr:hypothetical protein BC828DRAFT_403301 [Blastocladiella britannica]
MKPATTAKSKTPSKTPTSAADHKKKRSGPKGVSAPPPATAALASTYDARRRVFKQSFDSPLKVRWTPTASAEMQRELVTLMAEHLVIPGTTPSTALHVGLNAVYRDLMRRSTEGTGSLPPLAIVLLRGDVDASIAGPELYGWLPGLVHLARAPGHVVHFFVVAEPGISQALCSAVEHTLKKKSKKPASVSHPPPRIAAFALELPAASESDPPYAALTALAAKYPTPTVPFYAKAPTRSLSVFARSWMQLLPTTSKLLATTAPAAAAKGKGAKKGSKDSDTTKSSSDAKRAKWAARIKAAEARATAAAAEATTESPLAAAEDEEDAMDVDPVEPTKAVVADAAASVPNDGRPRAVTPMAKLLCRMVHRHEKTRRQLEQARKRGFTTPKRPPRSRTTATASTSLSSTTSKEGGAKRTRRGTSMVLRSASSKSKTPKTPVAASVVTAATAAKRGRDEDDGDRPIQQPAKRHRTQ